MGGLGVQDLHFGVVECSGRLTRIRYRVARRHGANGDCVGGDERLSGNSTTSGNRGKPQSGPLDPKPRRTKSGNVGRALRTAYDDMLRESVPKDFLDLLGKLD